MAENFIEGLTAWLWANNMLISGLSFPFLIIPAVGMFMRSMLVGGVAGAFTVLAMASLGMLPLPISMIQLMIIVTVTAFVAIYRCGGSDDIEQPEPEQPDKSPRFHRFRPNARK